MRFRKRANSVTAAGKLFFGDRSEPVDAALATEERSALLHSGPAEAAEPGIREESFMGADPTQRLLTCLGRFQRQVSKAEDGANQDAWCDECMNQIITGIEISLSQSWDNVREALTDTARILQSYEEPGRAAECVPFLLDSYEILCLMVGDIIVDNTRSGVMRKWRERYEQALNELARLGLRLVDDEEDPSGVAPARGPEASTAAYEELYVESDEADAVEFSSEYEAEETEAEPAEASPISFEDDAFQRLCESAANAAAAYEDDLHAEAPAERRAEPLEEEEAPALEDDFEWTAASAAAPETDESTGDAPLEEEVAPFEYAETSPRETGDFVPSEAPPFEPEREEVPAVSIEAPAPAPAEEADEIQALFRTVQNAVARGDVAQAKLLALQLAASMARLEVERAEHSLAKAQARLADNERAAETAQETVRQAEEDLSAVESRISETQQEFQAKRQRIGELRERATAIEAAIEDIDAQILALQERRADELEHRDKVEEKIEEALSEESRVQTDLEELSEAERLAQQLLQDHRARVERLVQEHHEQQQVIARANTALDERMGSAGEIERTLHQEDRAPRVVQVELEF